ncbi:hypothetical protein C922_05738 [Plasmodium inui San Antonio 1]|uniref:Uncharacterized protein n=1 Tax=Plasmodium inui San Antonio 1 TaxID=1237626 RepID=W7AF27_9APIC|nr:hypothetical protein C922_05738 [Plasmodium inui San Antonio 1]EUD63881.1 hypothetical protein C922_05738 [Plasmodium inui San Antonio 1]
METTDSLIILNELRTETLDPRSRTEKKKKQGKNRKIVPKSEKAPPKQAKNLTRHTPPSKGRPTRKARSGGKGSSEVKETTAPRDPPKNH